jgi:hypothetical protein
MNVSPKKEMICFLIMRRLLLVPGLGINLYSIASSTDAGEEVHFTSNTFTSSHITTSSE